MEATCVEDKRAPKEVATDDMDECGSIIDAFGIDDLLDFSNEDIAGPIGEEGMHLSADSSVTAETVSCNFKSKAAIEACTGGITSMLSAADSAKDFFVPCDDMVELEWLSNFVEDSFSSERNASATKPAAFIGYNDMHHHHHQQHHHHRHHHHEQHKQQQQPLKQQHQQQQLLSPVSVLESCVTSEAACHSSKVMVAALAGRPRRKRPRGAVWSKMLESSSCSDGDDESEPATSDSLSDCCALSMASSDVAATSLGMEETESATLAQRLTKQPRRNKREFATSLGQQTLQQSESSQLQSQQQRRCTHCLTQKTPQWRAGPEGPKTLCNACGVRYKSGRLLPEYRPAASPTFVSHKHSNSHRKVLEMRRQREMTKDGDDDDDVDVGVDDDVEIEDDDDDDEIEVVEEVDEDEEEKMKKKQKMMMMMMMEDEEADDVVLLS